MIETLEAISAGRSLDAEATRALFLHLMADSTSEAFIAGVLAAFRTKGETAQELLGATQALLSVCRPAVSRASGSVDTCGTGGDGRGTFNISTATALLCAAMGLDVVKHGNRSVTSRSGSADVIEALGIPFHAPGADLRQRFTFLFAPHFHPSLKRIGAVRRALGIRTIFNLIGPLANPARPDFQLVGVADRDRLEDVAHAMRGLGRKRAMVVWGEPGMDEATPAGPFDIYDVRDGEARLRRMEAGEFGLAACSPDDLRGGDAAENADIIRAVFSGERSARRDVVVLNAALVLMLTGREGKPVRAAEAAGAAIDAGAPTRLLSALREPVHVG